MHKLLTLAVWLPMLQPAGAQVRFSDLPYPVPPAAQAPSLPLQPYAAAPAKAEAPAPAPAVPAAAPTSAVAAQEPLVIRKGREVGEQLVAHARPAGWELVWDAPAYLAERDVTLPGDFEAALEAFLRGANAAGVPIRALFYRGNRTVRVWED